MPAATSTNMMASQYKPETQEKLAIDRSCYPILQNIVSTVNLSCKLDLKQIALNARNAEYNPKVLFHPLSSHDLILFRDLRLSLSDFVIQRQLLWFSPQVPLISWQNVILCRKDGRDWCQERAKLSSCGS